MAVHLLHQVSCAVSIPLIGIGGIRSGRDALEFILAGATAVQVGTATFTEPQVTLRIIKEIEGYCVRHEVSDIRDLIGALRWSTEEPAVS